MSNRITARRPDVAAAPRIEDDPSIVSSFLSDAAHVPGGYAAGVVFPHNEAEVAAIVASAERVLPVGAQSSLTGGATPRGDVVLSTRMLTSIGDPANGEVRVGAGVALAELQRRLAALSLFYPPVPTFDGAFVGGTVSTNAAGAATFKYGSTRPWVVGVTVVLASGEVLDIRRGETTASGDGSFEIVSSAGVVAPVRIPTYEMPPVPKLSAGYFARPGMDLVDQLFVVLARRELEQLAGVGQLLFERLRLLQLFGRRRALAHQRLRLVLVVPKVGRARQLVELVNFSL